MKKLLVTAIGAAAAFGAVAGTISTQRFESVTGDLPLAKTTSGLNALAGTTDLTPYWVGDDLTNTYKVVAVSPAPELFPFNNQPTKGLEVKTVFGNPLTLNAVAGGTATPIPASGLYFDSEVKFTVCEDEPDQSYSGAKIVMWLQEKLDGETVIGTNLIVRAGYLSKSGQTIVSTPTNYVCSLPTEDFDIDAWHRVTIKAIANITTGGTLVPGFAIYVDETSTEPVVGINCSDKKWDDGTFAEGELIEAADLLDRGHGLFPSMDVTSENKTTLTSAGFDGTGSITDLRFTDVDDAPVYAADLEEKKASLEIGDKTIDSYGTIAAAVQYIANHDPGEAGTAKITLLTGMRLDTPVVIPEIEAALTIDFAGYVITNTTASAIITNNAPALKIVNNSANKGGIYCVGYNETDCDALYQGGVLDIEGGYFWGFIEKAADPAVVTTVSGGSFLDTGNLTLADGKKFSDTPDADGLTAVIDKVNYTVKFISGEGSCTNEYTQLEGTTVAVPAAQEIVGKTFSAWSPAIAGETVKFEADATYTAIYTTIKVNVIFVDGETATTNKVDYGTTLTAGDAPAFVGRTGYTAAWDKTVAGTEVTAETTFTAVYTANTYTVTFYTNSVKYAEAEYTYGDAGSYSAPADPSVSGYTFGGWYTDNGTFNTAFVFSANVADNTQVAYAKLTSDGSTPIDPGSATPQTVVTADSEDNAIKAATITPPTGVDAAEYKANFDFSAKDNGDGTYTVTMTGIKDTVTEGAASTAVAEVLSAATGESGDVTIPAGLYYKITTMTALDDKSPTVLKPSTPSTGKVTVTKPGTDKGFIKVELGTKAFE